MSGGGHGGAESPVFGVHELAEASEKVWNFLGFLFTAFIADTLLQKKSADAHGH